MRTGPISSLYLAGALALGLAQPSSILPAPAQTLHGGVEEENYRLAPPSGRNKDIKANPLRLARNVPPDAEEDESDLAKPQTETLKGIIDEFQPNSFELGAERESKEMLLAWERWHHQFSAVLWQRWYASNRYKGRAQIKVSVTRDLHISVECLKRRGCLEFENTIIRAVNSLDLNPGLTFPAKSERQSVTFLTNIHAGNVPASYTWSKSDFETVRKDAAPAP
jgi:hypothetical protein